MIFCDGVDAMHAVALPLNCSDYETSKTRKVQVTRSQRFKGLLEPVLLKCLSSCMPFSLLEGAPKLAPSWKAVEFVGFTIVVVLL